MVGRLGTQGLFLGVISEIYLGGDYVFDGFFRATNSTKVRCKPVWVGRIYRGEGCAGQGSVWRRRATSGAGRLGRGAKVGRLAERRGLHADAWACGLPKASPLHPGNQQADQNGVQYDQQTNDYRPSHLTKKRLNVIRPLSLQPRRLAG